MSEDTRSLQWARLMRSLELRGVSVVGGGQDEETDGVTQGSPGEDVHEGESCRVVGLQHADDLLSTGVACVVVGHSILLW